MNKKNNNVNKPTFLMKIIKNGKVMVRYSTKSKRRFYNATRTINWQLDDLKVYLRVSYGRHLTNYGKVKSFWNDGVYINKHDFNSALNAFCEK